MSGLLSLKVIEVQTQALAMGHDSSVSQREYVAVVVVTHNSELVVGDLVSSLDSGLRGLDWCLVVVDNASVDDTVATVRRIAPGATVVESDHNGGYAAGINTGAAVAKGATAYLVLNPDVRLTTGCVASLLRALRLVNTGIAVPKLLDRHGDLIESQRREPTIMRALGDAILGARRAGRHDRLGEVVSIATRYDTPQTIDWAEGSTLLIDSTCLEQCGPWDERYFLYSEETEFALRARDLGFATRYTPDAVAVHLEGGSVTSERLWPLLVTNRVRMYSQRHGPAAAAAFWAAVTFREATRAASGRATSRAAFRALISPRRMRTAPGPDWLEQR